jgi:hypothetical protein
VSGPVTPPSGINVGAVVGEIEESKSRESRGTLSSTLPILIPRPLPGSELGGVVGFVAGRLAGMSMAITDLVRRTATMAEREMFRMDAMVCCKYACVALRV